MEMRHFVCRVLVSLFCQRSCIAAESPAWQNGAMIFTEKLVFLDLETTGANAATDRITEIGLVEVDAGQVSRWSTLVNPQQPIPPFIQHLTGINDRMVKDAPLIDAVLDTVRNRLEGGLFIAHNARFDYGFLNNACMRAGLALPNDVLCTVKLSRRLFPSERRHNLDTLIERHQLITGDRHRALADADLLWQLWNKFSTEIAPETFQSAVQALRQRPGAPQAKKKQSLREMK
jgi:DNA polymerase III subunit epsilon